MKANWGTYIVVFIIGFVAFMLTLVYKTTQHNVDLLTADYYAKEIKFQEEINSQNRSMNLAIQPEINVTNEFVILNMIENPKGKDITGSVSFIRYSDKNADREFEIQVDTNGIQKININEFLPGTYVVDLQWKIGELSYLNKSNLYIPG